MKKEREIEYKMCKHLIEFHCESSGIEVSANIGLSTLGYSLYCFVCWPFSSKRSKYLLRLCNKKFDFLFHKSLMNICGKNFAFYKANSSLLVSFYFWYCEFKSFDVISYDLCIFIDAQINVQITKNVIVLKVVWWLWHLKIDLL